MNCSRPPFEPLTHRTPGGMSRGRALVGCRYWGDFARRDTDSTADEEDIHGREDWQMTDQFLRRQEGDTEVERNPEGQDDQPRQEPGEQRAAGRHLDDADRVDEAVVGKPIDPHFAGDVEARILVEEGHAEFDVEQLLGEPEDEDRDPGANPEYRQREGEEPIGQVGSILLGTMVVPHDTTTNCHQIEGNTDEDDLLDDLLRMLGEAEGGDEEGGGEERPDPRQHPRNKGEGGDDGESGDAGTDRVV